ncbi:hypothetical protein ABMA27_014783 [Loxostege sticticalis]|uniref:Cathepsin propeptide inhibitor domain-containing protein n=1 Tax=Loxostege sticticalis TaxID=481309 RepID=A0ABR3IA75_LOXSC
MKLIVFIVISVLSVFVVSANPQKPHYDLRDAPFLFLKFVRDHDRQYKSSEDVLIHFAAFVTNLNDINKKNEASSSAVFDINEFADYTKEEFEHLLAYKKKHSKYSFIKIYHLHYYC